MLASLSPHLPVIFSFNQPATSPFGHCTTLRELASHLTSPQSDLDQCLKWKKEIKMFLQSNEQDLAEVDLFLKALTTWGLERDSQKTATLISDLMSLDLFTRVAKFTTKSSFTDVFDWAAQRAPFCPKRPEKLFKNHLYSEWRRCRPIIVYFIPNLMNIVLGAFNFLDSHKKFTTLWEKHLLLEIIYKFFVIPYCLVKALQPVLVVTTKVYVVSALIIVATGILVSCYQRWFKPLPDEVVNCVNLDKQMERGLIDPKVGQTKDLQSLIAALEVGTNVFLIGQSGDGKTALLEHFIQKKHAGELPEKLQKLRVFAVDCGLIVSSYGFGYSEIINQIKEQTDGYDDILFFFDEFYQLAAHQEAFKDFKKKFLDRQSSAKFVAAITLQEYREMQKLDKDKSIRRRVDPLILTPTSDEQTRLIVCEYMQREASGLLVTPQALQAIVEISNKADYMAGIGRPAKAIKLLRDAIKICRTTYNPHYVSPELSEARQALECLRKEAVHEGKLSLELLEKTQLLQVRIQQLEHALAKDKEQILKIKALLSKQGMLNQNYYSLTHLLAHPAKAAIGPDQQILYLWHELYAVEALKKIIQVKIDPLRSRLPMQIDENLVLKIYKDSQAMEEQLDQKEEKVT